MGQQQEKTVAEVLEAAASLIEPEGAWTQGAYYKGPACYCVLAAVANASGIKPHGDWSFPSKALAATAAELAFGGVNAAVDYNDAPERTQAEVVAKLREAAAVARERGL